MPIDPGTLPPGFSNADFLLSFSQIISFLVGSLTSMAFVMSFTSRG